MHFAAAMMVAISNMEVLRLRSSEHSLGMDVVNLLAL